MQVYIGVVSTNIFETLNPFWAAVDKKWIEPSVCRLFYVPENSKELRKTSRWLQEISGRYLQPGNLLVDQHPFDDENIPGFVSAVKEIIKAEKEAGNKVVLDVTSAEWNYIPASLMLLAKENRKVVKTVLYHQFSTPVYRETPYPLVPLTEQRLYNLLNVDALEDLSL
ncbi:MAG: hypothetical protein GXP46_05890 [Deferribacteres bacterium]|nr:hypothetical protein [Deferribacteres bacterium]